MVGLAVSTDISGYPTKRKKVFDAKRTVVRQKIKGFFDLLTMAVLDSLTTVVVPHNEGSTSTIFILFKNALGVSRFLRTVHLLLVVTFKKWCWTPNREALAPMFTMLCLFINIPRGPVLLRFNQCV